MPVTELPQQSFLKLQPVIRQQWVLFLLVTLSFAQLKTILGRLCHCVGKSTGSKVRRPDFQPQSCHPLSTSLGQVSSSLGFSCPACKMKAMDSVDHRVPTGSNRLLVHGSWLMVHGSWLIGPVTDPVFLPLAC